MRDSVSLDTVHHLVLLLFTLAILIRVQWYIMISICTYPITNDVEILFMCLFAICIRYLWTEVCPLLIHILSPSPQHLRM